MRMQSRKGLSVLLAFVLILAMSATPAFAAWNSFQKDAVNNGVATVAPPDTTPTTDVIVLPTSGTINLEVFSGADTTSVINNDIAYTVYNGGISSGYNGGARLHATKLSTAATLFNIRLDANANNVQQLATPYLDETNHMLYAATTFYTNQLATSGTTGWTGSGVVGSGFEFPASTTTVITYDDLVVPADFWQPQVATDINTTASGFTGNVVLTPSSGGTPINFGTSSYFGGNWTLYNNSGLIVPKGTYDVTITINNASATDLEATSIQFLTSGWNLWSVNVGGSGTPLPVLKATGHGQTNTPIYRNDGHLYFGIWEGDRSYYQYRLSDGQKVAFKPTGGDDFYLAGAVAVTLGGQPHVAFGGDKGIIYARPVGNNFGSAAGQTVNLAAVEPNAGRIRSTIMLDGTFGYLTSMGTGNIGYLWRVSTAGIASRLVLPGNSASTPVLSDNSYIYVGWRGEYNPITFDTDGGVVGVLATNFIQNALFDVYGNGVNPLVGTSGVAVQASPIVWTDEESLPPTDYIYFTTNSFNGRGYCFSYDGSNATSVWPTGEGGTSANPYALQGFASDDGYLVYGDDGNYLYIIH